MERLVEDSELYIQKGGHKPMNPNNKADPFEVGLIEGFAQNLWKVLNGEDLLPGTAIIILSTLSDNYGRTVHNMSWDPALHQNRLFNAMEHKRPLQKAGNVIGLESIAIPVDETFYQIRQVAFSIFLLH